MDTAISSFISRPPFREFMAQGSRSETEFIGFAGSQARTAPAPGPPFLLHAARAAAISTPGGWLP